MTEHVIGIDPGVTGALALLTDKGDLVEISDMPSLADGTKGRSTVNSPLLAELLARWHARQVFCEWTGSDRVQKALTLSDAASTIPERPYWTRFSADADAHQTPPHDHPQTQRTTPQWPTIRTIPLEAASSLLPFRHRSCSRSIFGLYTATKPYVERSHGNTSTGCSSI